MLELNDSWVTIIEADTYFNKKYGAAFWLSLSIIDKEKLLITAKNFILSMGYTIPDDLTSSKVKKAQMETAQFIYEFYDDFRKRTNLIAAGVKEFTVIEFSETFGKQSLPFFISSLIDDYANNQASFVTEITRAIGD